MKICFLLCGRWCNPHAGAVRPIVTWARAMEGHEVSIALLNAGDRMLGHLRELGIPHKNFTSSGALCGHVGSGHPDVLVADDNPPQLKLNSTLRRRLGIPCATYAQILFGSQSIVECIDSSEASMSKRIRHNLSTFVPFSAFRTEYKRMLGKGTQVIGNSRITATMLHAFYGVEPEGVVYPPLDTEVFFQRKRKGREGALLYLGSYGLDTDRGFIREIIRTLRAGGQSVAVFGNHELGRKLAKEFGVEFIHGCTDEELAGHYSSSAITICPQKWELFGYVPAESICCGTPVLAYNCMGPGEVLSRFGGGVLVNRREEFLSALGDMEGAARGAPPINVGGAGFDWKKSAAELAAILERTGRERK